MRFTAIVAAFAMTIGLAAAAQEGQTFGKGVKAVTAWLGRVAAKPGHIKIDA